MAGRKEREIALLDTESIFTYKRLEWVECSNSGKACVFDLRLMHDQACQARLTKDLVVLKSSNLYALQVFSLDVTENQPLNPQLFFCCWLHHLEQQRSHRGAQLKRPARTRVIGFRPGISKVVVIDLLNKKYISHTFNNNNLTVPPSSAPWPCGWSWRPS